LVKVRRLAKRRLPPEERRCQLCITLPQEHVKWIDEQLDTTNKYFSRSHLIEIAIDGMRQDQKE
jgi:hypothetical protein